MTMIISNPTHSPDVAKQAEPGPATAGAREHFGLRPPADPALREAFERALARPPQASPDEEAPLLETAAQPLATVGVPQARLRPPTPDELVFVSSQPVESAGRSVLGPGLEGATSTVAGRQPAPAVLGAALSALTMPASPEGIQHWQFSFSQPGSAVSGVTLTAQPESPWQVQVTLQNHALSLSQGRERGALDARLGELRQRLLARGAAIGDIELRDPFDDPQRR